MGMSFSFVTGIGFLGALVLLIASVRAGRQQPHLPVLWIISIVALSASILFRFALFVGSSIQGSPLATLPILIGNLAVILVLISVFWQPSWSGWFLIGSAVAMPLISLLFELVVIQVKPDDVITPVVLISYSLPALITGILLLISMRKPAMAEPRITPVS